MSSDRLRVALVLVVLATVLAALFDPFGWFAQGRPPRVPATAPEDAVARPVRPQSPLAAPPAAPRPTTGSEPPPPEPVLPEGRVLVGVVRGREAAAMSPLAGARVHAVVRGATTVAGGPEASTDAGGRFRLVVGPDIVAVVASAFGWLPSRVELPTPDANGGELSFELERGLGVEGRVVDPDGRPIADADVWCEASREGAGTPVGRRVVARPSDPVPVVSHARSGADGRFVVQGLDAQPFLVRASKDGYALKSRSALLARAPSEGHVLVLGEAAVVLLRFVDEETAEPLPIGLVTVEPGPGLASSYAPAPRWRDRGVASAPEPTAIRAMRLEFARAASGGGPPERPTAEVVAKYIAGYRPVRTRIDLEFGREQELEVRVPRAFPGPLVDVRFRLAYARGGAVSGPMEVSIGVSGEPSQKFNLDFVGGVGAPTLRLPPGPYLVRLGGRRESRAWTSVDAGASELDLRDVKGAVVDRTLEIEGNPVAVDARDPEGRVVRGCAVLVETLDGTRSTGWMEGFDVDAGEGPSRPLLVGVGRFRLRVNHGRLGHAEAQFEGDGSGTPVELRLTLSPAAAMNLPQTAEDERRAMGLPR